MNRIVRVTCPKEFNKKYMSRQHDNYINKLDVYHNAQKIFANIDDAEENLPIILENPLRSIISTFLNFIMILNFIRCKSRLKSYGVLNQ
jgi:hypothetical protein